MRRVISVLMVLILVAAGCLGSPSHETHSNSFNYSPASASKTPVATVSEEKCVCNVSSDLSKELSDLKTKVELLNASLEECRSSATLLEYSLNVTQSRLAALTSDYNECLVNLSACNATSLKLEECQKGLESAQAELGECRATSDQLSSELEKCRLKLNEAYDVLNRTYTDGSVELLIERDYYEEAIEAIDGATQEIYVMMFSMLYDPDDWSDEANDLINALIRARRRGVEVHVLLENSLDTNREAYDYLKSNGIDVSYDSPSKTLHAKIVVIDGRIVFLGSHNWSESALHWNHEVSVKIISKQLAGEVINYFWSVRGS
ncbi:phospholipase D-like domain-containing protein [Thermococcus peptonophilus]|uniref:phospholipase D-like domain-containing protein n=1 Tax=Thermococcus peptonophilus TaxID=53952 RepID=UPI000B0E629B|nr:phospholipase D-like domain-containing protein [Thermococcus peptonophilus]